MNSKRILRKNEKGATAVYAAVILIMLLMFAALGVDVNYLYGVRNELHNAADAGALAGASVLFDNKCEVNTPAAIAEATRVASANKTGNQAVTEITVTTGHWSFASKKLIAPSATEPVNAVKVVTKRSDTPSFFAKIFNLNDFLVSADAVAWRGYPGTFSPGELDLPFAVCMNKITDDTILNAASKVTCNMGRVINSGSKDSTSESGAWTNFSQDSQEPDDRCRQPTPQDYKSVVMDPCENLGNKFDVQVGEGIGLKNGMSTTLKDYIYPCWAAETEKRRNWNKTLPVITCDGSGIHSCDEDGGETNLVGAVNVNVIWITDVLTSNPRKAAAFYQDVPREMTIYDKDGEETDSWTCPVGYRSCWKSFVDKFDIRNVDNVKPASDADYDALYQSRAIYFRPDCTVQVPTGGSGGQNFGICAKFAKLVK